MDYISAIAERVKAKLEPSLIPDGDVSVLFRIYAVLVLAKGRSVTLEDVHNAWAAWMTSQDPHHPAIQPFAELDEETAAADKPYQSAIALTSAELESEGA